MIKYDCGCMYQLKPYKKNGMWKITYNGSQFCDKHFAEIFEDNDITI